MQVEKQTVAITGTPKMRATKEFEEFIRKNVAFWARNTNLICTKGTKDKLLEYSKYANIRGLAFT